MTEEKETDWIVNPEWENAPYEFRLDDGKKTYPYPNNEEGPDRFDINGNKVHKYIPCPKSSDVDLRILPLDPTKKYLIPVLYKRPIE